MLWHAMLEIQKKMMHHSLTPPWVPELSYANG
jgi:hypothetical protein